jgi:hypothetical protein
MRSGIFVVPHSNFFTNIGGEETFEATARSREKRPFLGITSSCETPQNQIEIVATGPLSYCRHALLKAALCRSC